MIDSAFLGAPPRGLYERSNESVQHFCVFGDGHFDTYAIYRERTVYTGSVGYERITIQ